MTDFPRYFAIYETWLALNLLLLYGADLSSNAKNICSKFSYLLQKHPPELFYKKDVFKNFVKFTGKHLCRSLFFNKVAGLRPAFLLKRRL